MTALQSIAISQKQVVPSTAPRPAYCVRGSFGLRFEKQYSQDGLFVKLQPFPH
jgi:hypothetical protein